MQRYRQRHGDATRSYLRTYNQKRRKQVIDHYGGRCDCCGEERYQFLTVDHKNNDGTEHRKEIGARGAGMIGWIIRNNYPDTLRILCHNCNMARGYFGRCPHEDE